MINIILNEILIVILSELHIERVMKGIRTDEKYI